MLAGRPGAQSAGAGLGAGPPDAPGARDGGGWPRPSAYLYPFHALPLEPAGRGMETGKSFSVRLFALAALTPPHATPT